MSNKASLGIALIAKDAEGTLGRCLDSIREYTQQIVVCVDVRTSDKTKRTAKRHGAEVHDIRVSELHDCTYHGSVWAQHFAKARTESFTYLDPSLDWWMWLDSDDVIANAGALPDLLGGLDPRYCAVWLPYIYSTIEGHSNTEFHRERLLRTRVQRDGEMHPQGWEWRYRVHEVIAPVPDGPMYGTESVQIVHQEGVHKTDSSARRNLLLLEIDLESDPKDPRAIFYMGNQYFAMQEWQNAVLWYERLLSLRHGNIYERWQTAIYLSMAYERLGNLELATQSAMTAMDDAPWHAEPYYRLAAINLAAGRYDHTEFWTDVGRTKTKDPPFFVFKNKLDYSFNSRVCLADAYGQQGRLAEAKVELLEAQKVLPDENVKRALKNIDLQEQLTDQANAFIGGVRAGLRGQAMIDLYERQHPDVKELKPLRDIVMPAMLSQRADTQPRVVFYCNRSIEEWGPAKLNESGIGGSESAVVEVAKRFAADGFRVDVYNGAGRYEGVYDGVGYWDIERYTDQRQHLFVKWRQPVVPANPESIASILWVHDLNYGADQTEAMRSWCRPDGRVMAVSEWHKRYITRAYDLPEEFVGYVPNGIDLARFKETGVVRQPMRCVYASSPDRGLIRLLQLWPLIREAEPAAELHIAYGWDVIDRMIMMGIQPHLPAFKEHMLKLLEETEGVFWLGRLPQDKLAELYQSAYCWPYPTSFLEVSCISAMEAMAAGAVPVTSTTGALKETIGGAGILVPGLADSPRWGEQFMHVLLGVLGDPKLRERQRLLGFERALELTWDKAYELHWKPLVESMLEAAKL